MKKITAETFLDFRFPGAPAIAPDGKTTALLVKQADLKENRYLSDVWVCREGSEPARLTSRQNVASFCWTPCGRIVFTLSGVKREKGVATDYYIIDPAGGEAELLCTLPVRGGAPVFLPGGKWLVSALTDLLTDEENPSAGNETEARTDAYRVFEEVPFWSNGNGDISRRRHTLFVCDPKTSEVKRLTPPQFDVYSFDCLGNTVVMTGASFDAVRPHEPGLYAADLEKLEITELEPPFKYEISALKLTDENTAVLQVKKAGDDRYACGDLCRLDIANNSISVIASWDYEVGSSGFTTDASLDGGSTIVCDGGKYYFIQPEFDTSCIRCLDKDGNISNPLAPDVAATSISVKNGKLVCVAMKGDLLPELYEITADGAVCLSGFNSELGSGLEVSTPEFVAYTGSDGFEIHGWVMKPAGYVPGNKYPAILNIHGGPRGTYSSVFFHEMQYWASEGYFVMYSNPRGSDGRGRDFANLYGKYGDWDYVNLMEFTDECLKRYPDIDEQRLGVTGGSYGGYMTNWMIGKTDRFKAACAQRSISNWISYEGTGDISYWFNGGEHGGNFETDAQLLWDISPLKFADKAKTPTLFIHSEEDYRCYMGEGITMYSVLKMNGVDARFVLFKGENHNLSRNGRPRPRLRRLEEIKNWMDKYLKEDEKNA